MESDTSSGEPSLEELLILGDAGQPVQNQIEAKLRQLAANLERPIRWYSNNLDNLLEATAEIDSRPKLQIAVEPVYTSIRDAALAEGDPFDIRETAKKLSEQSPDHAISLYRYLLRHPELDSETGLSLTMYRISDIADKLGTPTPILTAIDDIKAVLDFDQAKATKLMHHVDRFAEKLAKFGETKKAAELYRSLIAKRHTGTSYISPSMPPEDIVTIELHQLLSKRFIEELRDGPEREGSLDRLEGFVDTLLNRVKASKPSYPGVPYGNPISPEAGAKYLNLAIGTLESAREIQAHTPKLAVLDGQTLMERGQFDEGLERLLAILEDINIEERVHANAFYAISDSLKSRGRIVAGLSREQRERIAALPQSNQRIILEAERSIRRDEYASRKRSLVEIIKTKFSKKERIRLQLDQQRENDGFYTQLSKLSESTNDPALVESVARLEDYYGRQTASGFANYFVYDLEKGIASISEIKRAAALVADRKLADALKHESDWNILGMIDVAKQGPNIDTLVAAAETIALYAPKERNNAWSLLKNRKIEGVIKLLGNEGFMYAVNRQDADKVGDLFFDAGMAIDTLQDTTILQQLFDTYGGDVAADIMHKTKLSSQIIGITRNRGNKSKQLESMLKNLLHPDVASYLQNQEHPTELLSRELITYLAKKQPPANTVSYIRLNEAFSRLKTADGIASDIRRYGEKTSNWENAQLIAETVPKYTTSIAETISHKFDMSHESVTRDAITLLGEPEMVNSLERANASGKGYLTSFMIDWALYSNTELARKYVNLFGRQEIIDNLPEDGKDAADALRLLNFLATLDIDAKDLDEILPGKNPKLFSALVGMGQDGIALIKCVTQKSMSLEEIADAATRLYTEGIMPTTYLVEELTKSQDRGSTVQEWKIALASFKQGGFDRNNELHKHLEYTTFRQIVDHEKMRRFVKNHFSLDDYLSLYGRFRRGPCLSKHEKFELLATAYEAALVRDTIFAIKEQADKIRRRVLVVPNFSYGYLPVSAFIDELGEQGIKVHLGSKIPSTECHGNEQYIDHRLFKGVRTYIAEEQPIIVMVDGTQHLVDRKGDAGKRARLPDAYKGMLNNAIAFSDIAGQTEKNNPVLAESYDSFGKTPEMLATLRETPEYQKTVELFKELGMNPAHPYIFGAVHYSNQDLIIRQEREMAGVTPVFNPEDLTGPAMLLLVAGVNHDQLPVNIRMHKPFFTKHKPAFYDDSGKIIELDFQITEKGVTYTNTTERALRQRYKQLQGKTFSEYAANPALTQWVKLQQPTY